jgi:argininosuccinate lyase
VNLVAAAMANAQFDAVRLEARAAEGWTTLTELADTLVRDHGFAFRAAHAIAGRLMRAPSPPSAGGLAAQLADAAEAVAGMRITYSDDALAEILSARHFVSVRQTPGGPAPAETARASAQSRDLLQVDEAWLSGARDALSAAEARLAERSRAL